MIGNIATNMKLNASLLRRRCPLPETKSYALVTFIILFLQEPGIEYQGTVAGHKWIIARRAAVQVHGCSQNRVAPGVCII